MAEASDKPLNTYLHRRTTMDLVLRHLHCNHIMMVSMSRRNEKDMLVFMWAPHRCFKTDLKIVSLSL